MNLKRNLLVALATVSLTVSTAFGASNDWGEGGIGPFDAIGMRWVWGGEFDSPALTPVVGAFDLGSWVTTNTSKNAFASFDETTFLVFTHHITEEPSLSIFYVWHGDELVDSALLTSRGNPIWPWSEWAPTRAEFLRSATPPPIPEPETYAMLLAGLGLLGVVRRQQRM